MKRVGKEPQSAKEKIAFDKDDLEGTIQPYDNTLIMPLRIGGFLVKRVMID